jgi:hypothetical protein
MKRMIIAAGAALSLAVMAAAPLFAETSVNQANINVSATVLPANSLTAQPKLLSNSQNAASIGFNDINAGAALWSTRPLQYVQVVVNDNAPGWRLRIYTNNFTVAPATVTGHAFGGLVNVVSTATITKAPMAWMILPDTGTNAGGGPGVGNPACGGPRDPVNPVPECEAASYNNGWTFFKDLWDRQAPGTNPDKTSFAAADGAGYTTVAFGAPSFTRIVRPNVTGGNQEVATPASPFYLYNEADFSGSAAGSYTAKLVVELLNL